MSEYWKSTPKYWCKFCKVFVKDTKLERQQHDATPRHQGNIQKQLRGLHREKEQEDRQKQRAKDEVARLNGMVPGSGSSSSAASLPAPGVGAGATSNAPKTATLDERKRQMQQLADMGVEVPEEFKRETGMVGDWQTIKVTKVEQPPQDGGSKDAAAFGIRKRKFEDQEEEEAILGIGEAAPRKNRNWGSRMKTFPGSKKGDQDYLDALLGGITVKRENAPAEDNADNPDSMTQDQDGNRGGSAEDAEQAPSKSSELQKESEGAEKLGGVKSETYIKTEDDASPMPTEPTGTGVIFKKRKKIAR